MKHACQQIGMAACLGVAISLASSTSLRGQPAAPATGESPTMNAPQTPTLGIGGCGGVYLLAEPGPLVIEIHKRDRNLRGSPTELRAVFFGPDRQVIDAQSIPDDGTTAKDAGMGPLQRIRFSTTVTHPGVYGVNVMVSNDRYGLDIAWGFHTNCPKYLVETSRGHRDARHEEPIVLLNAEKPGNICFLPSADAFRIEVTRIPRDIEALTLFDGDDAPVASLPVSAEGEASLDIPAAARGSHPWRLHLPKQSATVHIDGVTRWSSRDPNANLSLWSPERSSWFPFHAYRWLLTPYSRTIYGQAGEAQTLSFRLHNNGPQPITVSLNLETDDAAGWSPTLDLAQIGLAPGQARMIPLTWTIPATGDAWSCRLRASVDGAAFSTYSTLRVRRGIAPAEAPLDMPITLKPYEHENEQFGYLPDYPTDNQVYFDMDNHPYVLTGSHLHTLRNGAWEAARLADIVYDVADDLQVASRASKIGFDQQNGVYLLATMNRKPTLLYSADRGRSFNATEIPGQGSFDIESFTGHNLPQGPPPFVRITRTASDPKLRWRSLNDLYLFLPELRDGRIVLGEPVLLSEKCIGLSVHSGIPASIVSRGSRVHIAWGEATDPAENAPGVPTYVATYDRETGRLDAPALVGYGPPANDVHNSPSITMDSKGHLHVLVGTHGRTFRYARSLQPNTASAGWTEAEEIGPGLRQTYVGLVCDKTDTLHVVFRLWLNDPKVFPQGHFAALTHMSKPANGPWSEPTPLIVAPFSEYSVFYHRLTIDRSGDLFLAYDYWSTFWFYRTDHVGNRRAMITSPNGTETWKLAATPDLMP